MKTVSLLPVILVFFASCYTPRYMYSPAAQNVPVLLKRGDSKFAANYSNNLSSEPLAKSSSDTDKEKGEGFDIQGAVAITDHFAIQANYFNRTERNTGYKENLGFSVINYKRNLTEIGLGYFKSLHRHDKVMFQVFGGVGTGTFSFTDEREDTVNVFLTRHHEVGVFKIYVQPAMQFRIKDNFILAVSSRLSIIQFNKVRTDYPDGELQYYHLESLAYGSRSFFEPAFINTFGLKKLPGVKFEYQFGTSFLVSRRTIDYHTFNFSLGLLLDIPKIVRPAPVNDKN